MSVGVEVGVRRVRVGRSGSSDGVALGVELESVAGVVAVPASRDASSLAGQRHRCWSLWLWCSTVWLRVCLSRRPLWWVLWSGGGGLSRSMQW